MYLMFKPAGVKSQWVPIQYVEWSWKGTATFANGAWTLTGANQSMQAPRDTTNHPIWEKNFAKGDYD
jgi:hypothetical protein